MRFAERHDAAPQEERRIGVLYPDSRDKGSLASPVTGTALETLANEAAVAIENMRLYREAVDKARLEPELTIAGEMQQALLPARQRRGAGFEAAGAMIPSSSPKRKTRMPGHRRRLLRLPRTAGWAHWLRSVRRVR